jgi:hypothetical protein
MAIMLWVGRYDIGGSDRPCRLSAPALPESQELRVGSHTVVADLWETLRPPGHGLTAANPRLGRGVPQQMDRHTMGMASPAGRNSHAHPDPYPRFEYRDTDRFR